MTRDNRIPLPPREIPDIGAGRDRRGGGWPFGNPHDADQVIGRITNDGYWDRRYRVRKRPIRLPELNIGRKVVEIVALTVYCLILFGTLLFLAAYFAVWMPVEVMAPR